MNDCDVNFFIDRTVMHMRRVQDNMILLEKNRDKLPFKIKQFQLLRRGMHHDLSKFSDSFAEGYIYLTKYYFNRDNNRPVSNRIYENLILKYTFNLYNYINLSIRFQFLHQNPKKSQKYLTTSCISILSLSKFLKIFRLFCKNCFLWKNSVGNRSNIKNDDIDINSLRPITEMHHIKERHHPHNKKAMSNLDLCEMCCDLAAMAWEKNEINFTNYYLNIQEKKFPLLKKYNKKIIFLLKFLEKLNNYSQKPKE